ncbi:hypothetical protein BXZ70DRAFT_651096 [Cristinia sonorae]|uniref:Uncharacterized protein n=1 Tax=Cristinia sonorae TaxID=1940300 RepID=A0A8K0XK10_9AGAR|nr:hypothetical protein BXZ70DRAFT_651096 [Cristinia sonorae]
MPWMSLTSTPIPLKLGKRQPARHWRQTSWQPLAWLIGFSRLGEMPCQWGLLATILPSMVHLAVKSQLDAGGHRCNHSSSFQLRHKIPNHLRCLQHDSRSDGLRRPNRTTYAGTSQSGATGPGIFPLKTSRTVLHSGAHRLRNGVFELHKTELKRGFVRW